MRRNSFLLKTLVPSSVVPGTYKDLGMNSLRFQSPLDNKSGTQRNATGEKTKLSTLRFY